MAAFDTTRPTYGTLNIAGRIGSALASLAGAFAAWNDARVTANVLNSLSDRELDDIGLSRGDIRMVAEGHRQV